MLAIFALIPAALGASLLSSWGIGFHAGVGGMVPTGSLADDLKACALFNGGLDGAINQARMKLDFSYGQPTLKKENPNSAYDEQGRFLQRNATSSPTLLCFSAQLGYTVLQRGKVAVTPMVGITQSFLSWDINHIKYVKDDEAADAIERPVIEDVTGMREKAFGWTASVDVDIKLHRNPVDFPSRNNQQPLYTSSLRITPFVNILNSGKGCCLGISLSYSGMLRCLM